MLEEIVGSRVKVKILRLLTAAPTRDFTLQDIATSLGLSTGSIRPAVEQLLGARALVARRVGRSRAFAVNQRHVLYPALAALVREENSGLVSVSREFAKSLAAEGVEAAVLFGSVARGRPALRSDIDVLVVVDSPVRATRVEQAAAAILETHDVNLSPLVLTRADVERRLQALDPLLLTIAEEGKLLRGKAKWLGR